MTYLRARCVAAQLALAGQLFAVAAQATPTVVADYMLNCQGCHLPDGSGYAAHGVPDLKLSSVLLQRSGGREYLARVPGVAQSGLDDARLAELLNWVLQRFAGDDLPANFKRYTAGELAAWRRQPYADPASVRRTLLLQPTTHEGQTP